MKKVEHSQPTISQKDIEAVVTQLQTGMIAQGELGRSFGAQFLKFLNAPQHTAVTTASGTAALLLALQELRITPGDEILLPTYACPDLLSVVQRLQAVPVLYDLGSHGWVDSVQEIKKQCSTKTKAIVVIHRFGIPFPVEEILNLSLPIIEDCAHAIGSLQPSGQHVGLVGDFAFFSFHATKCLATGEGGMLISKRLLSAEDQLSDLAASLGISQLAQYPEFLSRRKELAIRYAKNLQGELPQDGRNFYRFVVKTTSPYEEVLQTMRSVGVEVRKGIDSLLHRMLEQEDSQYPEAVAAFDQTISLPIYPNLSESTVDEICHQLQKQHITIICE